MFLIHRARFLVWFAARDLVADPRAFWATAVNVGTIGLLLAVTALAYGLAIGYEELRVRARERDPLARTLWVESELGNSNIAPDRVAGLRAGLPEQLANPDPARGVHPFRHVRWRFVTLDAAGRPQGADGRPPSPADPPRGKTDGGVGRTLAPADPLLDSLRDYYRAGGPFGDPGRPGVIVTAEFLRKLAPDRALPDPLPGELWTYGPGLLRARPVPVVGVVDYTLPLGQEFLVTERFAADLRADEKSAERVQSGPLPARWVVLLHPRFRAAAFAAGLGGPGLADLDRQRARARERVGPALATLKYADEGLKADFADGAEVARWQLASTAGPRTRYEWKVLLDHARAVLGPADRDHLVAGELRSGQWVDTLDPEPPGHPYLGVVVRDIRDLGDAADAVEAGGFKVINKDLASQIRATIRTADLVLAVLTAIIGLVGVIATWNLAVLQQTRANEKVSEIGMLKAMGMTRRLLRQVYLTEAAGLWLGGVLVAAAAVAAGRPVALWLLARWGRQTGEGEDLGGAFRLPERHVGVMLGASLAVVVVTTLLATGRARRRAPMESLNRE